MNKVFQAQTGFLRPLIAKMYPFLHVLGCHSAVWQVELHPRVAPQVYIARCAYHMLTVRWHLGCEKLQHRPRVALKVDRQVEVQLGVAPQVPHSAVAGLTSNRLTWQSCSQVRYNLKATVVPKARKVWRCWPQAARCCRLADAHLISQSSS